MSVQTSYNFYTDKGVAGGLYDLGHHVVDTFINEDADGVLKFGMGVGRTNGNLVSVFNSGTDTDFVGVVVNDFSTEMDMRGRLALKSDVAVGVLTHGKVWARIKPGITPKYGDDLYIIYEGEHAGCFTNATEAEAILLKGRFVGTKGTGNVAPIELF